MRFLANVRNAGCCLVGMVVMSALMGQAAFAAPPQFTATSVNVPIPTSPQSDVIVNLRQQGVVSGSAPMQVGTGQGIVFVNGAPSQQLFAGTYNFSDTFGTVCLRIFNDSYVPQTGDVITVQMTADNQQPPLAGATLTIINAAAPTIDPQNPTQATTCDDPNSAPVITPVNDRTVPDTDGAPGEDVTLTAAASDPEGDVLTYQWFAGTRVPIATGPSATVRLPDGANNLTLEVSDESGQLSTDDFLITVAPTAVPVANAGGDRTVADSDREPGESVTLDGSQSSDSDGTITTYEWFRQTGVESEESLGRGPILTVTLPDGANNIRLEISDNVGNFASDFAIITVGEAPEATVLEELPNLTPNQQKMAQALDRICGQLFDIESSAGSLTEDQSDLLRRCDGLLVGNTPENQVEALEELLGDDFAVARTQTLLFANTQFASVMDRLMALRGGARGLSLAGLNIVVDGKLVPLAQLQEIAQELLGGGASGDASPADEAGGLLSDKWGLWARGNYSFGEKDTTAASPSFDADQWALVGGLDYRLSDRAVIGVSLSYGQSSVDFNPRSEGALDTESWAASLYGSMYAAKNFYFDGILNVANSGYDAQRNISYVDGIGLVDTDASGDTDGMTLSGGLSGGYDFLIGALTLSPNLGVFYIDATIDGFTEEGAGGLNLVYDEQKFKSLTANLGLRATYAWNLPWGVLLPHFRADYVREFEDEVDVFGVRFAADPNATSTPPILIETENPDESYWRLAAGFSAQFKYGVSGYIEYQRLESFEFISFQDVSMGLRFQRSF
jgi:outer membrane autotransporter protein